MKTKGNKILQALAKSMPKKPAPKKQGKGKGF